jgi:hypothetical protein
MKSRYFPATERRLFVGIAVLVSAALIQIIGLSGLGTGAPNAKGSGSAAARAAQEQVEQQLVKLRSSGFVDSEVSRAGGQFALVIEVGKDFRDEEITVQVKRADGSVVAEVQIAAGIPVQSQDLNLQAGQYTLEVVNHTQWVCHLNVQ